MAGAIKSANGFDQSQASAVVKRFLVYNQYRLERTQLALTERQRVLLDIIGLLYHVNHEKLPGFVGHGCPCGVARYSASKDTLRAAAGVTSGFQYSQRRSGEIKIKSLFIMGSCGSLGHSGGSDLDIWLCHAPDITQAELTLLQAKAHAIEQWADSMGLEIHFFLMDAAKFVKGERNDLGGEDCGSAQHHLLLDEFYRTSILLCGCYPLWWQVPVEDEHHYDEFVAELQQRGLVRPEEVVDFGGVGSIPAGEFVGAGMWQLFKAIGSPYKSILKLFLTEAYASGYPDVEALSVDLKARIFNPDTVLEKLDPYLLLYDRLERYLMARDEVARLELVRRCIYFKANIALGHSSRRKHWKRDFLQPVIKQWGWTQDVLSHLDNRASWQVHTVMQERKTLVHELIHSYKFLSQFGRHHQQDTMLNAKDMTLLGHKLYAIFDRKPGKVDLINPGISHDIQQEKLSVHVNRSPSPQRISHMTWSLYAGVARPGEAQNALKKSSSLIELLTWCHVNKVMAKGTNVILYQGGHYEQDHELKNILHSFYGSALTEDIETNFNLPPVPRHLSLYINVFVDPMGHYTRRGIHKISNNTDSLGYSALKENLVMTIDQVALSSWREVMVSRYEGSNALLQVIEAYLMAYPPGSTQVPPKLSVYCFCATRPQAIAERVTRVMDELRACFYGEKDQQRRRYVLQVSGHYYVIQFRDGRPVIHHFDQPANLIQQLSKPQRFYSEIILDSHALSGTAIKMMCEGGRKGALQVYYLRQDQHADVSVIDERGSFIQWRTPVFNEAALINPLNHFLRQVEYRQTREQYGVNDVVQPRQIEYFELIQTAADSPPTTRPVRPQEGLRQDRYFDIHAQVDLDTRDKLSFVLQCDQEDFSPMEYGDQVYKALVRHLVKRRKHHQNYPVYITDLAISDRLHARSGTKVMQTSRYLDYKYKLEQRLNQALFDLYPPHDHAN